VKPREITTYTPGWCFDGDVAPWFWNRSAALYHPSCQLLYTLTRPFWIRVLGDWEVPRLWVDKALAGHTVGVHAPGHRSVRVGREGPDMRFDMSWLPAREGVLWLPAYPVAEFLERTLLLVPFGKEGDHIDWSDLPRGSAA
jgi:hypothetical protein